MPEGPPLPSISRDTTSSHRVDDTSRTVKSEKVNKAVEDLRHMLAMKKQHMKLLDSRPVGVKKEPQSHHNNRAEEDRASIDLVDIVCPVCDVATYDLDALLKHMEREHAADMFGCRLCPGRVGGWSLELIHKHVVEAHPQHDPKLLGLTTVLKRFVNVPSRLGRVNCRLCPPPYQLGGPGVWLCRDGLVLVGTTGGGSIDVVENHFIQVHGITDQNQMNCKLVLVGTTGGGSIDVV